MPFVKLFKKMHPLFKNPKPLIIQADVKKIKITVINYNVIAPTLTKSYLDFTDIICFWLHY